MQLEFNSRIIVQADLNQFHLKGHQTPISPQSSQFSNHSNLQSNHDLCEQIKQIKYVKNGKKRQLKLMKENVKTMIGQQLQSRRTNNKLNFSIDSSESSTCVTKLNKKINKKTNRRVKNKISFFQDDTSFDKISNYREEGQNLFENFQIAKTGILKYKSKIILDNIVKGSLGHRTFIYSHHITEGAYYLEFKILQPLQSCQDNICKNKPEIRIGVCRKGQDFKYDVPLGILDSIGFHLSQKCIIIDGKRQNLQNINKQISQKQIKNGDIVGFLLQFSPPHRNPDHQKNWQQSSLTFTLNGQFLCKFQGVKQTFYQPAFSLYNGACVEVHTKKEQMFYMPKFCLAYQNISQFIDIYR